MCNLIPKRHRLAGNGCVSFHGHTRASDIFWFVSCLHRNIQQGKLKGVSLWCKHKYSRNLTTVFELRIFCDQQNQSALFISFSPVKSKRFSTKKINSQVILMLFLCIKTHNFSKRCTCCDSGCWMRNLTDLIHSQKLTGTTFIDKMFLIRTFYQLTNVFSSYFYPTFSVSFL